MQLYLSRFRWPLTFIAYLFWRLASKLSIPGKTNGLDAYKCQIPAPSSAKLYRGHPPLTTARQPCHLVLAPGHTLHPALSASFPATTQQLPRERLTGSDTQASPQHPLHVPLPASRCTSTPCITCHPQITLLFPVRTACHLIDSQYIFHGGW